MKQHRQEAEVFVDTLIGTMRRAEQPVTAIMLKGKRGATQYVYSKIHILS
jgi:hypothetical protein